MTAPRKRPAKRPASALDRAAVRISRMYATRGESCWRHALALVARCDAGEILARLDAARAAASRGLNAAGLDAARRADLRGILDDAYLYAAARIWYERAETREGARPSDGLDAAMSAWTRRAAGVMDNTWYALRYRAAADLMEALGLPRPLALEAAQPAEAAWRART